ncbi:hypothetical protein MMMDOFMJ_2550 [Methylobacterium gnaphalii]|uniref:Insertion element IS402-like domain-containing protein n=1 Tax=Methylobacterium gnaphalii TaxID=1010610 RepID=A0A512JSI0_9HYPH|nr:hypothetical protein MGN01_46880 [Methylobacterium gnaphalii]GJD69613.1 hypothetical protein MMMDOFMJ_2550 [Methylobacterium gnaphalii]GLS49537.1 hypothetical protein GCM10007885_23860 [Methylobacterium gnaphalii]
MIEPLLPTDVRGKERWTTGGCSDDRRVLNGIFWRLRMGAPWADIPARYGPYTTCGNRFRRWRKRGIWDRLLGAVSKAYDGDLQMIDATSVRVHQHAACAHKEGGGSGCMGHLILSNRYAELTFRSHGEPLSRTALA